jgi:phosphoglycerol transferase
VSTAMSMIVFLPIAGRWGSAWAPGDMLSTYNNANHSWGFFYSSTTRVGFPGGMNLNLFPGVDITQNSFAAAVTLLSGSPFLGINLLLILSFPLTAALASLALRLVGLRGLWAIALAVSYSMIPYHFGRALGHAYLSTMYAAVTGVILAILIGTGRWSAVRRGSFGVWAGLGALVLVTAWSGIYYAAFGMIITVAAVLWRFIVGAPLREIGWNLIPVAGLAGFTLIGLAPAAIARLHENVSGLGERPPYESVILAGSLALALLPAPLSVLPRMGYVNEALSSLTRDAPFSEAIQVPNYGTWITTGCLLTCAVWCVARVRGGSRVPRDLTFLAYLLVVTLLFFIPWGLNSLIAEFITAQIRAWNRLLPVVLLLFVLMGGLVLARMSRLQRRPWAIAVPSALLLVVLVEQVLPFRSLFAENAARYGQETDYAFAYADDVNRAIPSACGIVQLPAMVYPENGAVPPRLNDYEHFWQSLTNPGKQWTYGAVRGSESGERARHLSLIAEEGETEGLLPDGVCGVHVDLRGYTPQRARELVGDLTDRFGAPVVSGHRGEWRLFSVAGPA